jgi:hypothetical protein
MGKQSEGKLNRLERLLPEGLLVDAGWLRKQGFSSSLRSKYVKNGWLEQPTRQVYRRKRGSLKWEQVVISLQTLLNQNLIVGGRTALDLQGYAHYLIHETKEVHLYGPKRPPTWVNKLSIGVQFVWHNSGQLFREVTPRPESTLAELSSESKQNLLSDPQSTNFAVQQWGQWTWSIILSSPERALLELLNELPDEESFHQVDKLVEGLANLSPRRLEKLLVDCKSVKVKRLFFFFADRHNHAWLKLLHKEAIDLGKGKRMLVRGGKLNVAYQITVPENLDGVQ